MQNMYGVFVCDSFELTKKKSFFQINKIEIEI